jgi:IS5 family transposase
MLRIHSLQQWYSLSDLAAEGALYQKSSIRRFALFLALIKKREDYRNKVILNKKFQ